MKLIGLAIAILALAISNAARAAAEAPSCATFTIEQSRGVPSDISAFFARIKSADYQRLQGPQAGATVRRCLNAAGNTITSFLSPIQKYVGVCHFAESDISDLFSAGGKFQAEKVSEIRSILVAPSERMLVTDASCPRQDSGGYIFVDHVSPGLFRLLVASYTQLASSPAAFDAAFSGVERRSKMRFWVESLKRAMQGHLVEADLPQVVRGKFGKPAKLASVVYSPAYLGPTEVGRYQVLSNDGWLFEFEFTPSGLKVVDLTIAAH